MRKYIFIFLVIALLLNGYDAHATNTYTSVLVAASTQAFSIADASQTGLEPTGDFTVEAWVYITSFTTNAMTVVSKDAASNRSFNLGIYGSSYNPGGIYGYINDASPVYSGGQLLSGAWNHIAYTYDYVTSGTSIVRLYVNGTATGTPVTDAVGPMANTGSAFQIGAREYTTSRLPFNGRIDDVRFYNTLRSAEDIASDYNCSLAGSESGLVSYWRFDNDATDSGPSGNNLTALNTPTYQNSSFPFTDTCSGGGSTYVAPPDDGIIEY